MAADMVAFVASQFTSNQHVGRVGAQELCSVVLIIIIISRSVLYLPALCLNKPSASHLGLGQ